MQAATLVIFAALLAVAASAPQYKEPIRIIAYENYLNADGSFSFGYEDELGTKNEQKGIIKALGPQPEDAGVAVEGAFSYAGDNGKRYEVRYVADENGYRPEGDFLPPIPPHAARQIAAAEAEARGSRPL